MKGGEQTVGTSGVQEPSLRGLGRTHQQKRLCVPGKFPPVTSCLGSGPLVLHTDLCPAFVWPLALALSPGGRSVPSCLGPRGLGWAGCLRPMYTVLFLQET